MKYIFNGNIAVKKGDNLINTIKKFTESGSNVSYPFGNEYAYISDVQYKTYNGSLKIFFKNDIIDRLVFDSENFQMNSIHKEC